MKLTFAHMGNVYVTAKVLLDELGVDYVIPSFNNKKALEVGIKHAPESVCLPLKLNLGNYKEGYDKGADTILITGGHGPCRFGYYCEMQKEILKSMNMDMDIITLEVPDKGIPELINRIKKIAGGLNVYKISKAAKNATSIAKYIDDFEKLTFKIRPREIIKGSTDAIYDNLHKNILSFKGYEKIKNAIRSSINSLMKVEINPYMTPLKVGIVGEIFSTIDPYTNLNIASKLGQLGIEIERPVTVSGWIIDHMLKPLIGIPADKSYANAAKPYLGTMIGGHAQETLGHSVLFAQKNFDGVIQIYPLTCMPEIVAESILPSISKDYDLPILTLIVDEMTGDAGYTTRLEAFVDLLNKRKEIKNDEQARAVSWN